MPNPRTDSLEERLLLYRVIEDRGHDTPCWIWPRARTVFGYGMMWLETEARNHGVHRVAAHVWLDFDLASSLHVLHYCDIPPCFNPAHLYVGTPRDNAADKIARGRIGRLYVGEENRFAKLTEAKVREIRRLHAQGGVSFCALGRAFGVSDETIRGVCHRQNWKHVD